MEYSKIVFVAQTGTCREAMAARILDDFTLKRPVEICSRGLVVQFPEPMNQKAEAVLIGNGIVLENFSAAQLTEEDITPNTLLVAMERVHRDRVLEMFSNANPEHVIVLNEFVGDELEILDPYGGTLPSYGLCYETLRKSLKKFVKILNEGE